MDALTTAAILGTEGGARFLCGPLNHWYAGGGDINRSFHNCSANWQTTQTPVAESIGHLPFGAESTSLVYGSSALNRTKPGNRHAERSA
jgi:hypothetical protein